MFNINLLYYEYILLKYTEYLLILTLVNIFHNNFTNTITTQTKVYSI